MSRNTKIEVEHPRLGAVEVTLRADARSCTARWRDGKVRLSCPTSSSHQQIQAALDTLAPRLLARRTMPQYRPGTTLEVPGMAFHFSEHHFNADKLLLRDQFPDIQICLGRALDPKEVETTRRVSHALCMLAKRHAAQLLIPRAQIIARQLGAQPSRWEISRGHRILGHCDTRGVIALSYVLVFLPQELRDYIVCHELAHLRHMDHSPEFHLLANAYMQGREQLLINKLHKYSWPILRN